MTEVQDLQLCIKTTYYYAIYSLLFSKPPSSFSHTLFMCWSPLCLPGRPTATCTKRDLTQLVTKTIHEKILFIAHTNHRKITGKKINISASQILKVHSKIDSSMSSVIGFQL